ncbi:dihydropteroate synthase [Leucobacter allii]|uniref:dihydropteroate synthase n=1 Tax=Leucobacter allii TaxID=2932247 RepID=UPI001FD294E6|nr:dihydropteroate synthase [Leucobacter allii]UOR00746.1 dihydropteroate synthase [Leucobacter allii]
MTAAELDTLDPVGAARGARMRVMGVLNVTPDSFSDGGRYAIAATAISRGRELVAQGAGIVDVGGESTRPGADPVAPEEEQRRVLPVIQALAAEGIAVSLDTIHASTAAAGVAAGARYLNDVSGGLHDPDMLRVAAEASRERGVGFIIGHWRGVPDPAHRRSDYRDVVAEVGDALEGLAAAAVAAGVDPGGIVLDPGLGFDKTGAQGWELLAGLDALAARGYPVLVGASRKRMLADALAGLPERVRAGRGLAPGVHERDLATAVVSALAARAGAWGVRVHDVAGTLQALAIEAAWGAGAARTPRASAAGSGAGGSGPASPDAAAVPDAPAVPAAPVEPASPAVPADRIALTGLEVFAHHGVFDFERERGQRFLIDVELAVDLAVAAAGDALERTVHYGELAEAVVAGVERDPVDLIETVAERVAEIALGFPGVVSTRVTVHKPEAPIDAVFADVAVTVVRSAGGDA